MDIDPNPDDIDLNNFVPQETLRKQTYVWYTKITSRVALSAIASNRAIQSDFHR